MLLGTDENMEKISKPVGSRFGIFVANLSRQSRKNPFLRFGLPLISLTVVGFYGLVHLQQGRKDVEKVQKDSKDMAAEINKLLKKDGPLAKFLKPKNKETNLEEELKALQEKLDINSFEYKKIPRPFDEESK